MFHAFRPRNEFLVAAVVLWGGIAILLPTRGYGQDTGPTMPPLSEEPASIAPSAAPEVSTAEVESASAERVARQPISPNESTLRFSFSGATWREVLNWLAEAGELSLYVDEVPPGSLTYSDSQGFSVNEAIARLNLFLVPRGFALVRRGDLLAVISLGDPQSLQQLDALARVVGPDELDQFNDHETVKVFLPLGEMTPGDVLDELQPLKLMTTPVVLPKSNQMVVTDTAKKVRSVVKLLESMQKPMEDAEAIRRFDLRHVDAETVLMVAGTHLGIPEDATSGIDITITTDLTGKRLFAVGSEEKLSRLESLLRVVDVPETDEGTEKVVKLVSHPVSGNNLQAIFDVLQTVLAGKSLRLSKQESNNSIVALADDEIHQQIQDTISELQAPAVEFAVVDLGMVDPYFAVSLIGEMFDLGVEKDDDSRRSRGRDDDDDEDRNPPPKVDADPGNRRLFVRGTKSQIEQVEQLVQRLQNPTQGTDQRGMRFVPLTGSNRSQILEAAKNRWQGENRLQLLPSPTASDVEVIERTVYPGRVTSDLPEMKTQPTTSVNQRDRTEPQEVPQFEQPSKDRTQPNDHFVSLPEQQASVATEAGRSGPPIRSQWVPDGILLQSTDVDALDKFEHQLRELSSQQEQAISPTVVYYLKYTTAEEAVTMLADLLDGGQALVEQTPTESLVNGSNGSLYSLWGSFVHERDGMTTVTSGTATIVSDARLNRLIVQGTQKDIDTIESYLKIVDKDTSITQVETAGKSHVIQLRHAMAADVAELIRQAFPGRVAEPVQLAARSPRRDSGQDRDNRQRGDESRTDDERKYDDKPTRGNAPKMAVAVHEPSNSLVFTAPDALFEQVKTLVESVDQRSERAVRVISPNGNVTAESLSQILAEQGIQATPRRDSRSNDNRRGR